MTRPEIPAELRRFILTSIPSVPYLEAVLLLHAEPAREWDAKDVSRRLYVPETRVADLVQGMVEAGLARPDPAKPASCRYAPSNDELAAMIDRLAAHYAADLVGVTDLIHSRVDKKAQQFADAFRWKKDT